MPVREHAAILTKNNSKMGDDAYLHFGTKDTLSGFGTYDRRLGYSSADRSLNLDVVRGDAATNEYETGLKITLGPANDFFSQTGARKSWGVRIEGTRTAVMGGDANDMVLRLAHSNYAVNTPAGSYARGLDISLNNRTAGEITGMEGGFISVRQRSTGAVGTLEGLQIDAKVDSGKAAIASELTGLRVEFDICANAPAASYGVVVRNRTDGVYTTPTAGYKLINDATSSCKGWDYGLDLMSAAGVKTVDLGDVRFSQQDAGNLPCVLFTGAATSDAAIVADVGADSLWADGCLYISVVDGAGKLFQKQNDVWIDLQA